MPNRENWRNQAQNMRKESRAVTPPTYQLGYGQMPDLPDHYPHNPNNRAQLQQKLAYQQALKARQGWLNTGNRPGQNYPELPPQQGSVPQTPAVPGVEQPTSPWPPNTEPRHRANPGVQLPQPRQRRNGQRGRYPGVTY